jgi:hypothetical protein
MDQEPALLLPHGRQHRPIYSNNATHIDVKHLLELLDCVGFCHADSSEASVAYHHVQPTVAVKSGVNRFLHGRLLSYIQFQHMQREALGNGDLLKNSRFGLLRTLLSRMVAKTEWPRRASL